MKRQIRKLIIYTLGLYIFISPLRDLMTGSATFQNILDQYLFDPYLALLHWNFILICILITLFTYLIYFKFYPKKQYQNMALCIIACSIGIIAYRYIFEEVLLFSIFEKHNYAESTSFQSHFFDNVYYIVPYTFLGLTLYLVQASIHAEKKIKELKNAELNFLKSQINPHFLFNNLNNIYSLVNAKSENALNSISKLSTMLRYSLYENDELISLSKEWKYIEDYLSLESYRTKAKLSIHKNIDESLMNTQIAPFLLIPFVENALKHGIKTEIENPIILNLFKKGNNLHFDVRNKIANAQKDKTNGIGIDNLKKRMEHIYPNNHKIEIKREAKIFETSLIIKNIC